MALRWIVALSALCCLALGFEPGFQYTYNYHGRSALGIKELKQQNAVVEFTGKVIVQVIDETTCTVKLSEWNMKRNGFYLDNPYFDYGDDATPDEIEGVVEKLIKPEILAAPFVVVHRKGSFEKLKVGKDEPTWIVNIKKAVASHLLFDITGVRVDGLPVPDYKLDDETNSALMTFENGVTGECATMIQINRLPAVQVHETEAFDFRIFDKVCDEKDNVYEIVKTKDFNRCIDKAAVHSAVPFTYACTLGRGRCETAQQRSATSKIIGCGPSADRLDVVHVETYGALAAEPFGFDSQKVHALTLTSLALEKKDAVGGAAPPAAAVRELDSLVYVFADFEDVDGKPKEAELTKPLFEIHVPSKAIVDGVTKTLLFVAEKMLDKPDGDVDNLERLASVARAITYLSLDEISSMWQQVAKGKSEMVRQLFIDAVVQSGSNPAIMFIKKAVESEEIQGASATWAVAAIGYHVKTPTVQLLKEIIAMIKSKPVQSSKMLKQTAFLMVADLLDEVCANEVAREKRFSLRHLSDVCGDESLLTGQFLPMLADELKATQHANGDHMAMLAAVGSLGVDEILPLLRPHIFGKPKSDKSDKSGSFDDVAERVRAVHSLKRLTRRNPEKALAWLMPLADNVAERAEVRMAAISVVLAADVPFVYWQRIASRTWFETNIQVRSFVHSMLTSISNYEGVSAIAKDMKSKAQLALELTKPTPFGVPYSMAFIKSSYLDEGLGVIHNTPIIRKAGEQLPVEMGLHFFYQMGPFMGDALDAHVYNYNMDDYWMNLMQRMTGAGQSSTKSTLDELKEIWDQLKPQGQPEDKRSGFVHIQLMRSVQRVVDLLQLEKEGPQWLADIMAMSSKTFDVNFTKFRVLAEIRLAVANELGLPVRYAAANPVLTSWQGQVTPASQKKTWIAKFDVANEFSWKLHSEIRVELPWSGDYVACGVDVRSQVRLPRRFVVEVSPDVQMLNWTYVPAERATDLLYHHIKPYTVSRNLADSVTPVVEDHENVAIISVVDKEDRVQISYDVGQRFGVDLRLEGISESPFHDAAAVLEHLSKYDANSFFNLAFAPLDLQHRRYQLRYYPETTKIKSLEAWLHYSTHWKNGPRSTLYPSGGDKPTPAASKIDTDVPAALPYTRPVAERLFKDLEDGQGLVFTAGFVSEMKDGALVMVNATLGLAGDHADTKDVRDIRVERSEMKGGARKKDYVLCGVTNRNWNAAPAFGFASETLYMTEDSRYTFGTDSCEQGSKMTFKAKVYRNETQAEYARNSPAGRRCRQQMVQGQLDSPACHHARHLDQIYNVYEFSADYDKMEELLENEVVQRVRTAVHALVAPFVVERRLEEANPKTRLSFTVRRHPAGSHSDVAWNRPGETIVTRNVRGIAVPFSPLFDNYMRVFYPLQAGRNVVQEAKRLTYAGVNEAQCFVGPKHVHTFDGSIYNYTIDGCDHVLITDSSKEHNIAVTVRSVEGQRKIVTVLYGKDRVEIDPSGFVSINGDRKPIQGIIKVYDPEEKRLLIAIRALTGGKDSSSTSGQGAALIVHPLALRVKVQASFVSMTGSLALQGKAIGLCGDFDQNPTAEFRTADRCALSSGHLMAASYKMATGDKCKPTASDVAEELKRQTDQCRSIDEMVHTHLPKMEPDAPTKCFIDDEPLVMRSGAGVACTSTEPAPRCAAGCKATIAYAKTLNFKCSGGSSSEHHLNEFQTQVTVPYACTTY